MYGIKHVAWQLPNQHLLDSRVVFGNPGGVNTLQRAARVKPPHAGILVRLTSGAAEEKTLSMPCFGHKPEDLVLQSCPGL